MHIKGLKLQTLSSCKHSCVGREGKSFEYVLNFMLSGPTDPRFLFLGLILYAAQDKSAIDGGGDFVSFGLRSGVPEFRFSLGSGGAAVIRGRKAISFGQWHTAKISRHVVEMCTESRTIFPGCVSPPSDWKSFLWSSVPGT